jgi:hypothetical protein
MSVCCAASPGSSVSPSRCPRPYFPSLQPQRRHLRLLDVPCGLFSVGVRPGTSNADTGTSRCRFVLRHLALMERIARTRQLNNCTTGPYVATISSTPAALWYRGTSPPKPPEISCSLRLPRRDGEAVTQNLVSTIGRYISNNIFNTHICANGRRAHNQSRTVLRPLCPCFSCAAWVLQ